MDVRIGTWSNGNGSVVTQIYKEHEVVESYYWTRHIDYVNRAVCIARFLTILPNCEASLIYSD